MHPAPCASRPTGREAVRASPEKWVAQTSLVHLPTKFGLRNPDSSRSSSSGSNSGNGADRRALPGLPPRAAALAPRSTATIPATAPRWQAGPASATYPKWRAGAALSPLPPTPRRSTARAARATPEDSQPCLFRRRARRSGTFRFQTRASGLPRPCAQMELLFRTAQRFASRGREDRSRPWRASPRLHPPNASSTPRSRPSATETPTPAENWNRAG